MKKGIVIKSNNVGAKRVALALSMLLALSVCIWAQAAYAEEEAPGGAAEGAAEEEAAAPETPAPEISAAGGEELEAEAPVVPVVPEAPPTAADLRNDLADVKDQLSEAKGEYDDAVEELKSLDSQIATLEAMIWETEGEIEVKQGEIDLNDGILTELRARIMELDREIFDQNSALNKRLRVMYQTDGETVLAVLLNSESFIDFLSNMEMIQRIHESDKAFLEELEIKLDEFETKKAEAEKVEEMLISQRTALEEKKDSLDKANAELAAAKQRAKGIRDAAAAEVERLEKESKRIEQELVNMTSQWHDYEGGAMAWPVMGPITSEFGMRVHPITGRYTMHNGLDIGVPSGTPVHAAADGIVYFSGWNSGGYGNLVMIDNGSSIVTMYAHNSALLVSKGQIVSRGEVIAYAGSTGNSTGPHCHFEVRVSGAPQNPRGWLG